MPTAIIPCNCTNRGQDRLHGRSNRVHNQTKGGPKKPPAWRCTVCATERQGPAEPAAK